MEKNHLISRVAALMKAVGITYQRNADRIDIAHGQLHFEDTQVKIVRPGFVDRVMSYQRMNLDRLISLART